MTETLCPISILSEQLTELEQTQIRCFLHCERWTVEKKGFRVNFGFFQRNDLPDGRVNETVAATIEELSDVWKLGAMVGVRPLC